VVCDARSLLSPVPVPLRSAAACVVVTTLRSHDGSFTRVGDDSGPRQRAQAVADRRDLSHVVVALHLRAGLPGRVDRTRARARRGLLFVRRARVRGEGQGQGREARQEAGRRRVAVQVGRHEEGCLEEGRQGRVADPAAQGRVHLPQPPRLRGRSRLRVALACHEHRQALRRDQAHGVLAVAPANLRP